MAVKLLKGDRVRYNEDMFLVMAEFSDGEGIVTERIDYDRVRVLWDNGDTVEELESDLELLKNPLKDSNERRR